MPSCEKTVTSWGRSPAKKRMTRNRSGTPERLNSEPPRWTGESGLIVRRLSRIEKRDGRKTGSPSNPEAVSVRCAQFSSVFEHRGIILTRRRTTDGITTSITRGRSGRIPGHRCSWSPIQDIPRVMRPYQGLESGNSQLWRDRRSAGLAFRGAGRGSLQTSAARPH
jgi:hypothetical protein